MMVVVKVMGVGGGKMELEVTGPCHSDFKQVFHYTRSKKKATMSSDIERVLYCGWCLYVLCFVLSTIV